jgi:hypothetical protein
LQISYNIGVHMTNTRNSCKMFKGNYKWLIVACTCKETLGEKVSFANKFQLQATLATKS